MDERDKVKELIIAGTRGEQVKLNIEHLNINSKAISYLALNANNGMTIIYIKTGNLATVDGLN